MEVEPLCTKLGRNDLGDMDLKHLTKIGFEAVNRIELLSLLFHRAFSIYLLVFTNMCTFIVIKILHKQSLLHK